MAADPVFPPATQPDIIRALQEDKVYVRVSCDLGGDCEIQERAGCRPIFHSLPYLCSDAAAARLVPRGARPRRRNPCRWHFAARSLPRTTRS
jgi:hypothetical protein